MTASLTTDQLKTITDLEALALKSALISSAGNGDDFGYTHEIKIAGQSKQAVGGVIASLLAKGILTREAEFGQFWFGNPRTSQEGWTNAELVRKHLA